MSLEHDLRVIVAAARNDIQVALTDRLFFFVGLIIPLNFLFVFILFALSGGLAPTAIVMDDHGPLAQQFVNAMRNSHSFRIHVTDAAQAQREIVTGDIVAVVTIPASFDSDLRGGRKVELPVLVNNLQTDFTNDIRRAVPLAITSFYASAFPDQVVVRAHEVDLQAHDTDYVPYLAVSVVVAAVLITGILQGSVVAAREYEANTIKELMLSPAPRWALAAGKVLGTVILNLGAIAVVTAVVVLLVGARPGHPVELIGLALLTMAAAVAIGILAGSLLKRRQAAIPLAIGLTLPLFFISGPFGPANWQGSVGGFLALLSPMFYAIEAFQHAFHGYQTAPPSLATDVVALAGFAVASIVASALVLSRARVAH